MRQTPISRRISIAVLCIFVLAFYHLYERSYNHLASFNANESLKINKHVCRVQPEWNASDRENLYYGSYNIKEAQLPSIGDAKFLGNPTTCLKADSRLDVYRTSSTEDHDWDAVQWGKVPFFFSSFFFFKLACIYMDAARANQTANQVTSKDVVRQVINIFTLTR